MSSALVQAGVTVPSLGAQCQVWMPRLAAELGNRVHISSQATLSVKYEIQVCIHKDPQQSTFEERAPSVICLK